jgi:hypothetical protein
MYMIRYKLDGEEQWETVAGPTKGRDRVAELRGLGVTSLHMFELQEQDWESPEINLLVEFELYVSKWMLEDESNDLPQYFSNCFGAENVTKVPHGTLGDHNFAFSKMIPIRVKCPLMPGLTVNYRGLDTYLGARSDHDSVKVQWQLEHKPYLGSYGDQELAKKEMKELADKLRKAGII